jgi:hypothetical protein
LGQPATVSDGFVDPGEEMLGCGLEFPPIRGVVGGFWYGDSPLPGFRSRLKGAGPVHPLAPICLRRQGCTEDCVLRGVEFGT